MKLTTAFLLAAATVYARLPEDQPPPACWRAIDDPTKPGCYAFGLSPLAPEAFGDEATPKRLVGQEINVSAFGGTYKHWIQVEGTPPAKQRLTKREQPRNRPRDRSKP